MRRVVFRIAALAAAILLAGVSSAADGVLYWMVDSSTTVTPENGGEAVSLSEFFAGFDGGSEFAARVRVTGGDITGDTFLDLYYPNGFEDGEFGVDFDGFSVGAPTGVQSSMPAVYSAGSPEYSFIIEIGNVTDDSWTTVAQSAASTYSSLVANIQPLGDLFPQTAVAWTPTSFTAVPEPSSGLLMAVGLALLALRRGRVKEA